MSGVLPDPQQIVPGIPRSVSSLIHAMLQPERDQRIAQWQDVIDACEQILSGAHLATEELIRHRNSMRTIMLVVAIVLSIGVAGTVWFQLQNGSKGNSHELHQGLHAGRTVTTQEAVPGQSSPTEFSSQIASPGMQSADAAQDNHSGLAPAPAPALAQQGQSGSITTADKNKVPEPNRAGVSSEQTLSIDDVLASTPEPSTSAAQQPQHPPWELLTTPVSLPVISSVPQPLFDPHLMRRLNSWHIEGQTAQWAGDDAGQGIIGYGTGYVSHDMTAAMSSHAAWKVQGVVTPELKVGGRQAREILVQLRMTDQQALSIIILPLGDQSVVQLSASTLVDGTWQHKQPWAAFSHPSREALPFALSFSEGFVFASLGQEAPVAVATSLQPQQLSLGVADGPAWFGPLSLIQ